MTLLDHYLKAVRMYLPKGPQQEDIIAELSEHLQSAMDEEAESLGRPLTDAEQETLLTKHGHPTAVAARYGSRNQTFSFGRQFIGPELFPLYARILAINWVLVIVVLFAMAPFSDDLTLTPGRFAYPLMVQFLIITVIFSFVDSFQRRAKPAQNWRFPPAAMQPIPRWQSAAGGFCLGAILLWWAALPFAPRLLLGGAAEVLQFSDDVKWIYVPVLLVLVAGVIQRAITYARPELSWLQSITRLVTNGTLVALLYPYSRSYPFIVVSPGVADVTAAESVARRINGALWWVVIGSLSFYWAVTCGYHVWLSVQQFRYARRRAQQSVS